MEISNLDRLVAEEVMGWKIKISMDGLTEYYDNGTIADGKWVENIGINDKDNIDVFKPSGKIQDAWLVVHEICQKFHSVDINIEDEMTNVIVTELFPNGHLKKKHQGYEADTPLAICYAALKAFGVEV